MRREFLVAGLVLMLAPRGRPGLMTEIERCMFEVTGYLVVALERIGA